KKFRSASRPRCRDARHRTLADQTGRELRGAAVLAPRATQYQCVPGIFYDGLRLAAAVCGRDLPDRLKTKDAAAAKFAQPGKRILEAIDLAERIQLIDHEPQPLFAFITIHGLENSEPHPR